MLAQARDEFVTACFQQLNEGQEDSAIQLKEDFMLSVCEDTFDEDISPNEDAIVDCQQQISPLEDFSAWDRCITSYLRNSDAAEVQENSSSQFTDSATQDTERDLTRTHIANENATTEANIIATQTSVINNAQPTQGVYSTPTLAATTNGLEGDQPTPIQFMPPTRAP